MQTPEYERLTEALGMYPLYRSGPDYLAWAKRRTVVEKQLVEAAGLSASD